MLPEKHWKQPPGATDGNKNWIWCNLLFDLVFSVKFFRKLPMQDIFFLGQRLLKNWLVLNVQYAQMFDARTWVVSVTMFCATMFSFKTGLQRQSTWKSALDDAVERERYDANAALGGQNRPKRLNSFRLGFPWSTRPRCRKRTRRVLKTRWKRALLLKRT